MFVNFVISSLITNQNFHLWRLLLLLLQQRWRRHIGLVLQPSSRRGQQPTHARALSREFVQVGQLPVVTMVTPYLGAATTAATLARCENHKHARAARVCCWVLVCGVRDLVRYVSHPTLPTHPHPGSSWLTRPIRWTQILIDSIQ